MNVIVTGASSGIGAATTEAFLKRGAHVVGVARSAETLQRTAEMWPNHFVPLVADVSDATSLVEQLSSLAEGTGGVDVLVNNAGVAPAATIGDTTVGLFVDTMAVNVVAPAAAIHALWPSLTARSGCIINISSLAQLDPFPGFFAYAASKGGLHMLTVVAAAEGAEHGVRAFTLAPGVVDTPLHRALMPESLPPVDGLASVLSPAEVARVVMEVVDGVHDQRCGWTLAMPSPAAVDDIQSWVDSRPGGGVIVLRPSVSNNEIAER
jgi:NAD(P)-dependent dehydrogenase (short-subunit alcohol dehydrogenase family)